MIRACIHCGQKNRVPAARLLDPATRCGRCHERMPAPTEPLEVGAAEFKAITESISAPILVDFWADWCGPCKMAAPEVAKLARKMAGKALVLKVDTEREPELASGFGIRSIPTFLVLQDGRRVSQHAGLVDHREMERWLAAAH
jgi:thioredoxin 2